MMDRPRCESCGAYLNTWTAAAGATSCGPCSRVVTSATCRRGHLKQTHWRPSRNDCRECARILQAERRARAALAEREAGR